MSQLTYPGVYVEDIPSGVRTITGVATSITAFLGRTARGPVNTPQTINNFGDFERHFGGLWNPGAVSFALKDFYLNGGSRAVVIRLYHPHYENQATQDEAIAAAQSVIDAALAVTSPDLDDALDDADTERDSQITADGSVATVANAVYSAMEAANGESDPSRRSIATAGAEAIPAGTTGASLAAAVAIIAAFEDAVQAAADAVLTAAEAAVSALVSPAAHELDAAQATRDVIAAAAAQAFADADSVKAAASSSLNVAAPLNRAQLDLGGSPDPLILEAANPGTWGNRLRARISHDALEPDGSPSTARFNLSVQDGETGVVETFGNLSLDPADTRFISDVLANQSTLVRTLGALPSSRPPASTLPSPGANPFGPATSTGVSRQASDGRPLVANDYLGSASQKTGLHALEDVDLFNLLCLPMREPEATATYPAVVNAAMAYCERRRAFFIMDPLPAWSDKDAAVTGINGFSPKSRNAAVFFPPLRQRNPLRDFRVETFPPCGAIAGVMARIDSSRGIWKTPAGLEATVRGITGLAQVLTDAENGELNPLGVNCIRSFPGMGSIVWGGRTLQGDDRLASEWKYLSVVRMLLYLQESLYRGTHWVVFEPNDASLWAQVRLSIGAFMQDLFRKGAFQGTTPSEAYFVKCDGETTTQHDINLGIVNIHVGFAPLKPAEFVVIKFQQINQSQA